MCEHFDPKIPKEDASFHEIEDLGEVAPDDLPDDSITVVIACCYGVARFIVQNKQATTLWSGSRDLYRV